MSRSSRWLCWAFAVFGAGCGWSKDVRFDEESVRPLPSGMEIRVEYESAPPGGGRDRVTTYWLVVDVEVVDASLPLDVTARNLAAHLRARGFLQIRRVSSGHWSDCIDAVGCASVITIGEFLEGGIRDPGFTMRVRRETSGIDRAGAAVLLLEPA